MGLRLGFHYHVPAFEKEGQTFMPGHLGCFVDSLAGLCEQVICFQHSPRPPERQHMDYRITSPNVEWVDIGPHTSVPRRTVFACRYVQPLRNRRKDLDVLLIRGPSPLLPAMAQAAGKVPVALLLVGDYLAGVKDLPQPGWRKALIRLWSSWNQRQQIHTAKRSLTFVNSHLLYQQLQPVVPHLLETRTTTLKEQDFYAREDTCQQFPIHLLYTGRLDRAKGLKDMVEALAILTHRGRDCVLDLVGWSDNRDPILEEIQRRAAELGIVKRVVYHGFKPVGPELFQYYRNADIYVIASTASEGFPRTIWEAMANSLPVVATKVGSIPFFLVDRVDASLIKPNDPMALADAVQDLTDNPKLRKTYIKNGIKITEENTLEKRAEEIIKAINTWLN